MNRDYYKYRRRKERDEKEIERGRRKEGREGTNKNERIRKQ